MAQSLAGTIDALFVACRDVIFVDSVDSEGVPALVSLGKPGQYQTGILVGVAMGVRMPIERPTMGTSRSREITAEIEVATSVYVPGDESATLTAYDMTTALQGLLETYLRTGTNLTLGGACREAWVSGAEMSTYIATQSFDDPNIPPVATGRIVENTLTVTAKIRY